MSERFTRVKFRRDTAATWTAANPVLQAGELGLEADTRRLKAGDGVTAWNSLDYIGGEPGGGVGGATDLSLGARTSTTLVVASSTGADVTLPAATNTLAGLATAAQVAKLDGIAANATANASDFDLRNRATHNGEQAVSTITGLASSLAAKADLVGGVIPSAQIPAIAITQYLGAVSSEAAMLALEGQSGDWCIRTDGANAGAWVLSGEPSSTLANWVKIPMPPAPVQSINGQVGVVVLGTGDIGESGGNLYHTAARAIGSALTGFTPGAGTVTATDTILQALQKIVGELTGLAALAISSSGTPSAGQAAEWNSSSTIVGVDVTGSGNYVRATNPALVTPALGTPSSGTLTNCTGLPTSGIAEFAADTKAQVEEALEAGPNITITPGGSGATRKLTISATSVAAGGTKTLQRFTPRDNQPPAANYATLDTRNSVSVLEFDAATDESARFVSIIPEGANLSSGILVRIFWMADTATSGNVRWAASFEATGTDLDTDSFGTEAEVTSAANGTSGIETVAQITCTAIDSAAVGDRFRLRIVRKATDATNDTMTGDAQLVAVEIRQVA